MNDIEIIDNKLKLKGKSFEIKNVLSLFKDTFGNIKIKDLIFKLKNIYVVKVRLN